MGAQVGDDGGVDDFFGGFAAWAGREDGGGEGAGGGAEGEGGTAWIMSDDLKGVRGGRLWRVL